MTLLAKTTTDSLMSLRIDTAINPTSYTRRFMYSSLALVVVLMSWLADLALWQYVVILIIAGVIISYLVLSRPILLHITQPPLNKRVDQEWQLLMRTARADELWQARLISVQRYYQLIHLDYEIIEPRTRTVALSVFKDQVDHENWRQLCILANTISSKTDQV